MSRGVRVRWLGVPLLAALAGCGGDSPPPGLPDDAEVAARVNRALESMAERRWEEVGPLLAPLLARSTPPPDATWIAGSAAFELGRYPEAVALLDDAVRRKPEFLPNAAALGFARRETGDFAGAEATFRAIIAARPSAYKAHYGLGLVALDQDRLPEARLAIEAALAIEPGYLKGRAALGRLLFEEGRLAESRAELERLIADWPSNEQALYLLAQVQSALGDQPAADATLARRAAVYRIKEQLGGLAARRRSGAPSAADYALEIGLQLELGEAGEAARTLDLGLRAHPGAPELQALKDAVLVAPGASGAEPGVPER